MNAGRQSVNPNVNSGTWTGLCLVCLSGDELIYLVILCRCMFCFS